jgi:general secretion pathway protein G
MISMLSGSRSGVRGFTLFELVVTLTVLSILIMGTIPLAQNAAKRQRELRLRESLRDMRQAIDEFKRDTIGACPSGSVFTTNPTRPNLQTGLVQSDPRSRVVIDDCTIFTSDNLDRYPPTLDILVSGVKVRQRGLNLQSGSGLAANSANATEINQEKELTKVYLREMPIDPMTGQSDWKLRSSYQAKDEDTWDNINVFDVRSASEETALNDEKYSDW